MLLLSIAIICRIFIVLIVLMLCQKRSARVLLGAILRYTNVHLYYIILYFEEGEETGVPGENPRRLALRKGATCQTAQTGTGTYVLIAGRIHTGIGDRRVTTAPHAAPILTN